MSCRNGHLKHMSHQHIEHFLNLLIFLYNDFDTITCEKVLVLLQACCRMTLRRELMPSFTQLKEASMLLARRAV